MGHEPKRKLVLKNLDEQQDNESIMSMCKLFGNIIHFNRPLMKKYAFVTFEDVNAAQDALNTLKRKNVNVQYAKDDSMTHNALSSPEPNAGRRNDFKSYSVCSSDDGLLDGLECGRCHEKAGLQCERCGDYYCSTLCQTADWNRHRLICFPMPRLIRAKSTSSALDQTSRNASVTNSSQRKRVETHDTSSGSPKLKAAEVEAKSPDSPELRQPRAPPTVTVEKDAKIVEPPAKVPPVLTPSHQLHDDVDASQSNGIKLEPTAVATPPKTTAIPTPPKSTAVETPPRPTTECKPVENAIAAFDEVKNGSKVRLVYTGNHWSAYIRSAALDAEYSTLLQRVIEAATTAAKLKELPKRNDIVSAPFFGDYYRAVVIKADSVDLPVRVAFLDFGNIDEVKFDELRELNDELKNTKRFTFRIYLDGVDRETPNPGGLSALKQAENRSFIVHSARNESIIRRESIVKLIDTKTNANLNEKVASTAVIDEASPVPVTLTPTPAPKLASAPISTVPAKESKFAKIDLNCKRVMILDDALFVYGKVACTDVKNKQAVITNESIIQDCGNAAAGKTPFKPKIGDRCMARVSEDGEFWWFRAECLRVNDVKTQLMLLDSGKTVTLTLDNVREFDAKCDFAPQTTVCKVKNISVQDGKATEADQAKLREKLTIFEEFDVQQIELTAEEEYIITFSFI